MADEATQDESVSTDVQETAVDTTALDTDEKVSGEDALGDPGKRALDTMKAEKRAALQEARDAKAERDALQAKLDGKEAEHAAAQERRALEDAALAKANERILKAEIRAAAATALADPADALLYLDLSSFEVGNDGEVDADAVKSAIADLVKNKPYLAAQSGSPGTVFESPAAHRAATKPGQLTQADLKGMTADQINTARAEGRLNDILGIKN